MIAVLYKVEFANEKGLTDPACTDQTCIWNKSFKEINPRKVKDISFQAHKRHNPDPKFTLNNGAKQEFDPRPAIHQTTSTTDQAAFLQSVRKEVPDAVINISFAPPREDDIPASLQDIADNLLKENPDTEEDELARLFLEKLSFNDSNLHELEKATRGQQCQRAWSEQRKGRITASNFHNVYTKVKTLLRMRGQAEKTHG